MGDKYKGQRSQTREPVPPELSWSLSEVEPGIPAGYSQAQNSNIELTRRRSGARERVQPAAKGYRSQGRRGEGATLAVRAAYGPRRSKSAPLSKGLSQSIRGSSSAPRMPRANPCPQGGVPASHIPPPLDELGKLLRWNGCGCWDVLRWFDPPIAHRRRGPRSGHNNCLHESACGAITAAPHLRAPYSFLGLMQVRVNPK